MTEDQIKHMVERFLNWRLPENFNPDNGITFERFGNKGTPHQYTREPSGTNLLDAEQATAMVRYMIDGIAPARKERPMSDHAELIAKLREPQVWPTWAADAADALESLTKDNERLTQEYKAARGLANIGKACWEDAEKEIKELTDRAEAAERALADLKAKCEKMAEGLRWCIFLIEAAHAVEVKGWRAGHDDVELSPDGKYRLSHARAALAPSPEEPSGMTTFENCTFEPGQLPAGTPRPRGQEAVSEWRDIATAPKDGTRVLLTLIMDDGEVIQVTGFWAKFARHITGWALCYFDGRPEWLDADSSRLG